MKYLLDDDIDISTYEVYNTFFLEDTLRIILVNKLDSEKKVLQLKEVVCFYCNEKNNAALESLRIQSPAGAFGLDLSLRLQRPEIAKYNEVFLITEGSEFEYRFRVLAKEVQFRDINNVNDFFLY